MEFKICIIFTGRNIRLVNGSVRNNGRLEVRMTRDSEWGTVCDDEWDEIDAQVACRELGYTTDGAIPFYGAEFGEGTGPILLDDLMCLGNETTLFNCLRSAVHNCEHFEDVGVFCSPGKELDIMLPNALTKLQAYCSSSGPSMYINFFFT